MAHYIPSPDEYDGIRSRAQSRIRDKYLKKIAETLHSGDNPGFEIPKELDSKYLRQVVKRIEKVGWDVEYSGTRLYLQKI